jgi:hypothetical protein
MAARGLRGHSAAPVTTLLAGSAAAFQPEQPGVPKPLGRCCTIWRMQQLRGGCERITGRLRLVSETLISLKS